MTIVQFILFILILAFYFYWRLPKGNPIKEWIDNHSIGIGNALLIFWILFFMSLSPRLAIYFGIPMLVIGGVLWWRRKASKGISDQDQSKDKKKDPNNLGDPSDFE